MLTFLTAGESHGPQLTAIVDGFPAGFQIDISAINFQLARRQKSFGRGARMKIENDTVEILSGIRHGYTLGSPITIAIKNLDWENWRRVMHPTEALPDDLSEQEKRLVQNTTAPRPGHADLAGGIKYGHKDFRNVLERASARETAARVALGSLTRQFLEHFNIAFASHVVSIGDVELTKSYDCSDLASFASAVEKSEVRCIDENTSTKMIEAIKAAKKNRDSLGGVVEVIVRGLPVGLGGFSQWQQRLDSSLAAAVMSIPSVKGVEIGLGFEASKKLGSEVHDEIFYSAGSSPVKKNYLHRKNNAGGIEGGIANGEDIVIRFGAKPLPTLNKPLMTVDVTTQKPTEAFVERSDNCVVPVLGVIGEAMTAMVLAEAFLQKFGSDSIVDLERNYKAFLDNPY